ncbi:MAG: tRNA uridine(34) 5-carboxymethylaminomethyl modification radical SAM/GNAT enzyme Elp3 [Acidobacteria bacterium]|nr:MAG: tRNA uridine(34) 5-carboxymethylaminomethyl modification radical SAM/GNAT enzyme Elp3 [Acidobacteriota bacterium]
MARAGFSTFEPRRHERQLVAIIDAIRAADGPLDDRALGRILRRHPKDGCGAFSKSEIIRGFRALRRRHGWDGEGGFVARLRMKPVRTASGVAPVTVLTKPFPCPGECIFCPSDVRMPKSYLAREPGAQRAAQHRFDPYGQTLGRLLTYHHNGHRVDKVELIVLGGTWSSYPEPYQRWFVTRCFEALNDFEAVRRASDEGGSPPPGWRGPVDFDAIEERVDGRDPTASYNRLVTRFLRRRQGGRLRRAEEAAGWRDLLRAQRCNESAAARCVALVLETRPDEVDVAEVLRLRRLGATKVQLGVQSLCDEVLRRNRRGHDVACTRRALRLLRGAGFKLHVHWMPNLYGSDPARDVEDFRRLFDDPAIRPDELKIYPCSLIDSAELMRYYDDGRWRPYEPQELLEVLSRCLLLVPPYCRVTRIIRDIPGDEIVSGNKTTNLRQRVEAELARRGRRSRDVRAREIRRRPFDPEALRLEALVYDTAIGEEHFLQFVTPDDHLCGFLRLSLPAAPVAPAEIATSAMIREVHVYGGVVGLGQRGAGGRHAQHLGLGRRLIAEAARRAAGRGFRDLAVISAVGTRDYYRRLGFADGPLYQHRPLCAAARR